MRKNEMFVVVVVVVLCYQTNRILELHILRFLLFLAGGSAGKEREEEEKDMLFI